MATPVRLQLSRKRGFNLQALSMETNGLPAVKVDRSTPWGNPFPVRRGTSTSMGESKHVWRVGTWAGPAIWFKDSKEDAVSLSVEAFSGWITQPAQSSLRRRVKHELKGKNLACWCKDGRCHADVLLKICEEV